MAYTPISLEEDGGIKTSRYIPLSKIPITQTPKIEGLVPPKTGLIKTVGSDVKALFQGKVPLLDIAKEIPSSALKVGNVFATTFVPAITNFFKTTGSIFGEGLAYAVDKNVRTQYQAGNLDILPTITETTQAKLAKTVIAAGIETAVFRSFPDIVKMKFVARGGAGALQGLGFAVASGLAEDKSAEDIIKDLPVFGVSGGVLGIVSPYLLPLLKAEMKQLPNEIKNVFKGLRDEIRPPKLAEAPIVSEIAPVTIKTPEVAKDTSPASQAIAKGQSFDEWVKGQGDVAFHGTQSKEIRGTPNVTRGSFGRAFYLTNDAERAANFGKDVRIKNPSGALLRKPDQFKESNIFAFDTSGLKIKEFVNDADLYSKVEDQDISAWARLSGWDGIKIKSSNTTAIYRPEKLKLLGTPSQLRAKFQTALNATKGQSRISVENLQDFYNILNKYYDIAGKTSFQGQIKLAGEGGTNILDIAGKALKATAGQTPAVRQKALERILEEALR